MIALYKDFDFLSDEFLEPYKNCPVDWGFASGPNSLGEITYRRTYSRDGEQWWQTVRRVVEGTYEILYSQCKNYNLPFDNAMAIEDAQNMFDLIFNFKFLPPGRGLWMMGTEYIRKHGSAALNNCGFVSTRNVDKEFDKPFRFLMDVSMLGVGCGFNTLGGSLVLDTEGAGKLVWDPSFQNAVTYQIPDSREGWVESMGMVVRWGFGVGPRPVFDYSLIRKKGSVIKGFGGISEGPEPLMQLHKRIEELVIKRMGESLSSRDITDIQNMIGCCVVAGNVRRSAEIALGVPADKEFLNLKNYELNPERAEWGWVSNNSLYAEVGMDYTPYAERIIANGEPGLVWLENMRAYSRMMDKPDNKDYRVEGCNPCVSADTWVMTDNGPQQVADLIDYDFALDAIVDGKAHKVESKGFFSTGVKPVYRLLTEEGWEVKLTADHKVLTDDGWKEAKDLTTEDRIVINDHAYSSYTNWNSFHSEAGESNGYVLGLLIGDGTFANNEAVLSLWRNQTDSLESFNNMKNHMLVGEVELADRFDGPFHKLSWIEDRGEMRLKSRNVTKLASEFGVFQGHKVVTDLIESGSKSFYIGFLRGLFDADGHVEGSKEKGVSIRLGQSHYENLQRVQRMLARLGIHSVIRNGHPERETMMPDGKGGKKSYACKASYRLIIASRHAARYMDIIGFNHTDKAAKFMELTKEMSRGFYDKPNRAILKSFEYVGEEPVYDVTVADVHAFDGNGLMLHNCGEQSLENYELCCLVETFPYRHKSLEEYKRTLKYAFIYAKAVTLIPTHWPETNAVMLRNRRIGTSMSGVAQFLAYRGQGQLVKWCKQGYNTIEHYDNVYSEWLCVRPSIKKTSIKPSGTVSLLAGATPGCHYPTYRHYIRRVRFAEAHPDVAALRDAGYHIEPDLYSSSTVVVEFPVAGDDKVHTEREVSLADKMAIAVLLQNYWADNQVSCTATFDRVTEGHLIPELLKTYDTSLKSISFLPILDEGAYEQMPYEAITKDRYEELVKNLKPIIWETKATHDQADMWCDGGACMIPGTK